MRQLKWPGRPASCARRSPLAASRST